MSPSKRRITNSSKILFLNFSILVLLLGFFELLFGQWLKPKPLAALIQNAVYDKYLKWDAKELYRTDRHVPIAYTRDAKGYRNFNTEHTGERILTIGGSTTDQRFVSDSNTWQRKLQEKQPSFNFINGGVDGQSSLGHLQSIKYWHRPELQQQNISAVIIYAGINDLDLAKKESITTNPKKKTDTMPSSASVKDLISQNSAIYKLYRRYLSGHRLPPTSPNWFSQHGSQFTSFKPASDSYLFTVKNSSKNPAYIALIRELSREAHQAFPEARIIFIQQQVPGCLFIDKENVLDRHPELRGGNKLYCKELLETYQLQDKAFESIQKKWKPLVLKMYLTQSITDEGVYDAVHTNSHGSEQIATYLHKHLPLNTLANKKAYRN